MRYKVKTNIGTFKYEKIYLVREAYINCNYSYWRRDRTSRMDTVI